ncbi:MarR family transcriptional regulator [Mediterraneibacter sp. NSJ-55]|uniref:MarR family transcriptional regulator n=1 Tax=Mediterraneibacter hominis TaxID=2763054 RepID=A0A923RPE2_9FIRM|nr:MarR family transcriptional regulator [Mediterraneibacter hominis]MBC5688380.1 MarR family transcriptional regulator [Mediterraneibacter hominis]
MTDMTNTTVSTCNQCPKHCPIDNLQCGKGRRVLEVSKTEETENAYESTHSRDHRHKSEYGSRHGHSRKHKGELRHNWQSDSLEVLFHTCAHCLHHSARRHGQDNILSILNEKTPLTQKELQDMLHIQPGSMSEILTKLEDKGLIIRTRDESDRRKSILHLTKNGTKTAQRLSTDNRHSGFEVLTADEQAELKSLLKKLLSAWKNF